MNRCPISIVTSLRRCSLWIWCNPRICFSSTSTYCTSRTFRGSGSCWILTYIRFNSNPISTRNFYFLPILCYITRRYRSTRTYSSRYSNRQQISSSANPELLPTLCIVGFANATVGVRRASVVASVDNVFMMNE